MHLILTLCTVVAPSADDTTTPEQYLRSFCSTEFMQEDHRHSVVHRKAMFRKLPAFLKEKHPWFEVGWLSHFHDDGKESAKYKPPSAGAPRVRSARGPNKNLRHDQTNVKCPYFDTCPAGNQKMMTIQKAVFDAQPKKKKKKGSKAPDEIDYSKPMVTVEKGGSKNFRKAVRSHLKEFHKGEEVPLMFV